MSAFVCKFPGCLKLPTSHLSVDNVFVWYSSNTLVCSVTVHGIYNISKAFPSIMQLYYDTYYTFGRFFKQDNLRKQSNLLISFIKYKYSNVSDLDLQCV